MNRLLGYGSKQPKPDINASIANHDKTVDKMEVEMADLEAETKAVLAKLKKYPKDKQPERLKRKAMALLKKQKEKDKRYASIDIQRSNLQRTVDATQDLQNTMMTLEVMKQSNKALKKQYGKVNIDKIEKLQDEMAELMEIGQEINDSISQAFDLPEDVDEFELDAELDAMLDDPMYGQEEGLDEAPGFLQEEVPTFVDEAPQKAPVREAAGGVG